MGWTIPAIKKAIKDGSARYKITDDDARRVLEFMVSDDPDGLTNLCVGGSWDAFERAADRLGVKITKPMHNRKAATGKELAEKAKSDAEKIKEKTPERVTGEALPLVWSDGVPADIVARVDDAIKDYCTLYGVENLKKERQTQWKAACMYTGRMVFKGSEILVDESRRGRGGRLPYDISKLEALSGLWLFLCIAFDKAPFIDDFCYFAGVNDSWFYQGAGGGGLTPEHAHLLQKLQLAQERGLAGLIADGRQNPTGALAILNHWHGWTQVREIVHTDGGKASTAAALPSFGGSDPVQITEKPENALFLN